MRSDLLERWSGELLSAQEALSVRSVGVCDSCGAWGRVFVSEGAPSECGACLVSACEHGLSHGVWQEWAWQVVSGPRFARGRVPRVDAVMWSACLTAVRRFVAGVGVAS